MSQTLEKPSEEVLPPALPESKRSPQHKKIRLLAGVGVLLLTTVAGFSISYWLTRSNRSELLLSGRIEGYETDIGAKIPGRVNFIAVREGDRVRRGQVIVRLDDAEIQAQLQGTTAQIAATSQQAEQARAQVSVIDSQINEAELNLQQARGQTQGQIFQAEANLAAAESQFNQAQAQLAAAQSDLKLAKVTRDRYASLRQEGAVSQERLDQAQTQLEAAQATLKARQAGVSTAQKQVNAAQGALTQAQTSRLNPGISRTRIQALQKQLESAQSQLQAAQQQVKVAEANRQQIQAQMAYLNVISPINGVVTARSVEPGAVVASGRTLLSVINLNTVYLRGFIPEGSIGKVRVGQPAQVFLDSNPNRPLKASVAMIDPQASFTPENIYFQEDRVKQVFGVKLRLDNPAGFAKPGMPADARILLEDRR